MTQRQRLLGRPKTPFSPALLTLGHVQASISTARIPNLRIDWISLSHLHLGHQQILQLQNSPRSHPFSHLLPPPPAPVNSQLSS